MLIEKPVPEQMREFALRALDDLPAPLQPLAKQWRHHDGELTAALWAALVGPIRRTRFLVAVNASSDRWQRIAQREYTHVDQGVTAAAYPADGDGETTWELELLDLKEPLTTTEILRFVRLRGRYLPNRAMTECFLEAFPGEQELGPILSLCGRVFPTAHSPTRACICAGVNGERSLLLSRNDTRWLTKYRVLALRR